MSLISTQSSESVRKLLLIGNKPSDPLSKILEGGGWKSKVLPVVARRIDFPCLPTRFLSLFPLPHPRNFAGPPAPPCLPPPVSSQPGRRAGRRASALLLSAHPSACFHPRVLCLCNLCSRRRGQLPFTFPLTPSLSFFFYCIFPSQQNNPRNSRQPRRPLAFEGTRRLRFPAKMYRPLPPPGRR